MQMKLLMKSLCSRYHGNLESSMSGSAFIFDAVQLMYYKFHKVILDLEIHLLVLQTAYKRKKQ